MNQSGKQEAARVFFALSPDAECAQRLFAVAEDLVARLGGRSMARSSLHLTLAFVGAVGVDRLPELMAAAAEAASAAAREAGSIVLDRLQCSPSGKMLWAVSDQSPPRLALLGDDLVRSLVARGFAPDRRQFVAHVTLLRGLKRCPAAADLLALQTAPVNWRYDDFVLLRSRDALYERLGLWALASG